MRRWRAPSVLHARLQRRHNLRVLTLACPHAECFQSMRVTNRRNAFRNLMTLKKVLAFLWPSLRFCLSGNELSLRRIRCYARAPLGEFGDDCRPVRKRFRSEIRNHGTIITLYEPKGDSSQNRTLTGDLRRKGKTAVRIPDCCGSAPRFSHRPERSNPRS